MGLVILLLGLALLGAIYYRVRTRGVVSYKWQILVLLFVALAAGWLVFS